MPRERPATAWCIMVLVVANLIVDASVEHGASDREKAIQQNFTAFCLAAYSIEICLRIVGFGAWHSYPPPHPRAFFKRVACVLGNKPMCMYMYMYMYMYMHVNEYVYVYVYVYVCMCKCTCICMSICINLASINRVHSFHVYMYTYV